jgi:hypothetical protein
MREKLDIEATSRTPAVSFDFMQNHLKITGESYPEDVTEFYGPVFTALDGYLGKLGSVPAASTLSLSISTARAPRPS